MSATTEALESRLFVPPGKEVRRLADEGRNPRYFVLPDGQPCIAVPDERLPVDVPTYLRIEGSGQYTASIVAVNRRLVIPATLYLLSPFQAREVSKALAELGKGNDPNPSEVI